MSRVSLAALPGTNPIGLLAALGALDAVARVAPELDPALRWTDTLVPRAELRGPSSLDALIEVLDEDRRRWPDSLVLRWPAETPLNDVKASMEQLDQWADDVVMRASAEERADADLFRALLAQGAAARKGDAKPTHLHFTAGQQQFVAMARRLAEGVTADDLREALVGPWRYESTLPVLGWDARGERIYALRGANPANEKKLGVPGADWLAFLGLTFFPVALAEGILLTTGCERDWQRGAFCWPLWSVDLTPQVVRSVLTDGRWRDQPDDERRCRGVFRVLRAPIRRADHGGYGSFGPCSDALPTSAKRGASDDGS